MIMGIDYTVVEVMLDYLDVVYRQVAESKRRVHELERADASVSEYKYALKDFDSAQIHYYDTKEAYLNVLNICSRGQKFYYDIKVDDSGHNRIEKVEL